MPMVFETHRSALLCALFTIAFLLSSGTAAAQAPLTVAEAEELVRTTWFEGMPTSQAARIDEFGVERLVQMLADPAERQHHGNILFALGVSGERGAYDAIAAWAATPRSGEVDRATFRAWQALPHALGHLARRDPRAVALLTDQLAAGPADFRFRHIDGARLERLTRRGAATGLALSGRPEARTALDMLGVPTDDAGFAEALSEARALHDQVARGVQR